MIIGRRLVALLACLALAWPVAAAGQVRLKARPHSEAADSLPAGITPVGKGAYAYRPAPAGTGRPGLLVLFHGAGGDARRFIELFRAEADRRNLVLLSIQSTGSTWDVVARNARDTWNVGRAMPVLAPGADARKVNAALAALFRRVPVDPGRIIATGFSDGASYALSLGLGNDPLFTGIIALAPGFAAESPPGRRQRIAIAHGRNDRVLSYSRAQQLAEDLRNRGYPLEFLSFDGGHGVDTGSLSNALDFVLAGGGR
ncbi:MAG TPA: hypothetical protein VFZ35_06085 [Sphingomicrobium sp.]